MKKITLFLSFLFCASCYLAGAQHQVGKKITELQQSGVTFQQYENLLTEDNSLATKQTLAAVQSATYAGVNQRVLTNIFNRQQSYISIQIPYQGALVNIQLYKANVLAEGFHLDTDVKENITYSPGVYYRGIIEGDPTSVAAFSFFEGEFNGIFASKVYGNVTVGKLEDATNKSAYVVYEDVNLMTDLGALCSADELETQGNPTNATYATNNQTTTTNCVSLYFEIDYDLYLENNSDEEDTADWMTSLFNNVQTLYDNDGIAIAIKSIYVWTNDDPYTGSSSADYLYQFVDQRPAFDGDIGQLIGIDPGGLGGVAFLDQLCNDFNYGYADVFFEYETIPTYSWNVNVIAHELGHSLGSPHTHACAWNGNDTAIDGCAPTYDEAYAEGDCETGPVPYDDGGTIMSYCHLLGSVGINLSNGFGTQPATLIANNVDNSSCLSTDCINTCINAVEAVTVSEITTSSFQINWVDNGSATSWQVAVNLPGETQTWNVVTETSYEVTNLDGNTYYEINVKPDCSDISLDTNAFTYIAATTGDVCAGITFTDTGGTTGDYGNGETLVRTFTPDVASNVVTATFTQFDVEDGWDYMYVYDGADTSAPVLTPNGLTGNELPEVFTSTAADGSLTFEFISDSYYTTAGWEADISCTVAAGVDDIEGAEFNYYPNPTKGKVTITAAQEIENIAVYNVAGQLLYKQIPATTTFDVDMSQFAVGTYFFKVTIEGKQQNFKIMKY